MVPAEDFLIRLRKGFHKRALHPITEFSLRMEKKACRVSRVFIFLSHQDTKHSPQHVCPSPRKLQQRTSRNIGISHIFLYITVRGSTLKRPTLARPHSNHLHELFTTGGPGKEHGTNNPPPTGRVWERSKGDTTCPTTSQNPSCWHPSWLNKACTARMDSESE